MPKASAATSSRCRPTPGSSCRVMEKPDVDHIEGLSPAISIEQKSTSHNPRSTVGTITEIYDYLRLLYARVGTPRCPDHDFPLEAQTVSQMVDQVLALPEDSATCCWRRWSASARASTCRCSSSCARRAIVRVRVDGALYEIDDGAGAGPAPEAHHRSGDRPLQAARRTSSSAWPKVSRPRSSSATAWPRCSRWTIAEDRRRMLFSSKFSCPVCDYSLPELEPRLFSFNSPMGACPACDGLGVAQFFDPARVVVHPGAEPGRRRRARLGPAQCLLLPADRIAGEALRVRRGYAVARAAGKHPPGRAVRQRQRGDRLHLPHRIRRPQPAQAQVRRHRAQPGTPLPRNRIAGGARRTGQVHQRPAPARTAGRAPEPRRAQCVRRRASP